MCGNIKITRENKGVHHNVYIQRNQRNLPIRHHRNRFIQRLSGAYTEKIGELNPKEVQSWENSDTDHMYRVLSDPRIPENLGGGGVPGARRG